MPRHQVVDYHLHGLHISAPRHFYTIAYIFPLFKFFFSFFLYEGVGVGVDVDAVWQQVVDHFGVEHGIRIEGRSCHNFDI